MAYVKSEIADDIEIMCEYFRQNAHLSFAQDAIEAADRVEVWLATTRDGLV